MQIVTAYFDEDKSVESEPWVNLEDSVFQLFKARPEALPSDVDIFKSDILYNRMMIAIHKGDKEQADRYFKEYKTTDYSKKDVGLINSAEYLRLAGRYAEAADNLTCLDAFMHRKNMEIDLEVIDGFLLPKLYTNYMAGRKDSALRVSMQIYDAFGTALTRQKEDETAKLASIYDTEGKERRIAEQQVEISHQRIIGLTMVIIFLTVAFIVYTLIRRRAAARLAEVKTAQERIESELRIARDIQMSMVPSVFPEREGLDMYGSMTPAKEVGGDLYGYLMLGDKLYFAVGDVSGKGVPASLFMAQATRLFLTLAKQGMMPAEICSRINDALSGDDNENSMFVTFWLGLVDLTTGHLDFCNAGHNPPIIGDGENGGEFLDMIPNAPIGLLPGLEYEGEEIDSIKGRPLFIYTDGLNEAENPEQEQFGDDHLLDILRSTHFDNTQQVIETLKTEVEKHRNGAEPNDDLTMMCLRVM
jgi:serine phosphatase RsbU (regulator of sigma subunit)